MKPVTIEVVDKTTTILHISGEVDVQTTVESVRELISMRMSPPKRLVIDASEVTFLDSSGISALVMVAVEVRKRGGEVAMTASATVRRVIEMCGVESHLGLSPLQVA